MLAAMAGDATLARRCAGWLMMSLGAFMPLAHAQEPAPEVQLRAQREGEFITVSARVEIAVQPAEAWAVLTDYESYPRFIKSISLSRVVARNAKGIVLQQKGDFGILFFSYPVEARLLVVETPPHIVVARSIDGSFRDMMGRYELEPMPGGVRLVYKGRFIPEFSVPPLIGMPTVRYALERHFQELADEIVRRARER